MALIESAWMVPSSIRCWTGRAHQAVLVDPAEALELGGADDRAQMVAAALVDHLDLRTGQGLGDQPLDLVEI